MDDLRIGVGCQTDTADNLRVDLVDSTKCCGFLPPACRRVLRRLPRMEPPISQFVRYVPGAASRLKQADQPVPVALQLVAWLIGIVMGVEGSVGTLINMNKDLPIALLVVLGIWLVNKRRL